ncbi:hypothetical protein SKAU_G00429390 [Synaphobranchus kaupii]|uniref:Uncharacterized protein n=1 Tax=Synaphobranchus kaupii TaxID=118154 RepID=A0A9Q1E4L2_SYNKA|nr:hypothetical protein SKAU_G00429390 [Synaphobranchus kaupii]
MLSSPHTATKDRSSSPDYRDKPQTSALKACNPECVMTEKREALKTPLARDTGGGNVKQRPDLVDGTARAHGGYVGRRRALRSARTAQRLPPCPCGGPSASPRLASPGGGQMLCACPIAPSYANLA